MPKTKAQALTLEEFLSKVLIPTDNHLYTVPDNWVWTQLGEICAVKGGKRLPKGHSLVEEKTDYPYIRVVDFDNYTIKTDTLKYSSKETQQLIKNYIISSNDVYMSIAGTIGKVGVIPDFLDGGNLTENAAKIITSDVIDKKYLLYLLDSDDMQNQISDNTIATTQAKLALFRIESLVLPLPPLTEQHRIVNVIDSLFEKLDRAKALVQSALDSFENRKAAILHKAFTGELTAIWREKNGISSENWEDKSLSDLCNSFQYGTSKKSGSVIVLRMGNLQKGEIDWTDLAYSNDDEDNEKYRLSEGDVLFNRTNSPEHVGKTSVYRGEQPTIFAGYLIRINYRESLDGYYLNYVMNSQRARRYCHQVKSDGVNQSNINAKKLAAFTIPYCCIGEQREIVRILDDIFNNEKTAQELSDTIEKIDHMKKAILARAFRGELGTNDPSDESALDTLKKLIANDVVDEKSTFTE